MRFRARGESIIDWARERGFSPANVYAVLSGRVRGDRGAAHRIAVALELKPPAVVCLNQDNELTR